MLEVSKMQNLEVTAAHQSCKRVRIEDNRVVGIDWSRFLAKPVKEIHEREGVGCGDYHDTTWIQVPTYRVEESTVVGYVLDEFAGKNAVKLPVEM